jgi:hypothetical protein
MASRRSKRGRPSVWVRNGHRTPLAHKLVLLLNAGLEAHGEAMIGAILKLQKNHPEFKEWPAETLRGEYYHTAPLPPPPLTKEESRWVSLLIQWGKETKRHPAFISAEQAREIVDHLIAFAPQHRRADLDQLFTRMSIHRSGREKIKQLRLAIARLAANPNDWPIPISRRGRRDVVAGKIEGYLREVGSALKQDIATALGLPLTTTQVTLCSLTRHKRIVREGLGVYAPWSEGPA